MKLKLYRQLAQEDGIFSVLKKEHRTEVAQTLERAYEMINGDQHIGYIVKLQSGTYSCKRGSHRLHGMTHDFETFEVTGVKGHSGILFHWGNYNKDSDGCILLGERRTKFNGVTMITDSKATFAKFMAMLDGIDSFELEVI